MNTSSSRTAGVFFVLGAALLWGTTGTAQAFAPAGFDPTVIGTLRLVVGGVALLALAGTRREIAPLREWRILPLLLAGLFTAGYQLCFFAAVARTGVAVGTIVGIGSSPIAAGILGFLFRGERPGRRWALATVLAIIGCSLLSLGGGRVQVDPLGILLALGAGASYAAYTLAIKGLLEEHSPNAVMALVVCAGALMLSPLLLGRDLSWVLQPRAIAVVLHLGLATMALSYWLFARGLRTVPVATAVTLSLAEPMTASLLGIFVLGEVLTLRAFSGIGLIFSGLMILALPAGLAARAKRRNIR
ncbi:DME family drug/metabolite transporter [Geothermobacter ehrlichii]|uniref:DME family drug/metabolite transporter n=1 Tax=Geothermobacter ehrlichii TaxID=213224 RepID=A0A5D3WJC2_9BACT|nr:EamA family transporter [Geothermobacter ehrlichii]TYO99026.1 DME family drug/metabolite transporter [Geothermobacter ehrlichii]